MNDRRKLTLAQWSDKYEVPVAHQKGLTFVVLPDQLRRKTDENMSWDLAHLIDYAVSSVSGPVAWLTEIDYETQMDAYMDELHAKGLPQVTYDDVDPDTGMTLDEYKDAIKELHELPPDDEVSQQRVASTKIVKKDGEYIVRAYNAAGKRIPQADYFTTDKADAEGTAKAMLRFVPR